MGQNVGQDRLIYEKKPLSKGSTNTMAETVGFEPTDAFTSTDFESVSLWPLRYVSVVHAIL